MIYLKLYMMFFKIGLFSIGGGLATLPFLQEIANKYGWISSEQLLNMIAISESTPGPIGINTATFVGNTRAGTLGGIIATLGIITPSIIIIIVIAHYFQKFSEEKIVQAAFRGIRPAVTGLLASVGVQVSIIALFNIELYKASKNLRDLLSLNSVLLFVFIFILMRKLDRHPIFYIIVAGLVGVVFKF